MTAVATHLVMSFAQTLMHYKLGHRPMGGKFFRNHINFHHTYYSKDHLVSRTYLGDEGNNTPFFFIPVFLVGACTYLLLPFDLFVVQVVACAAAFYAHVFFDKEYHVEGSRLQRFAWFRRKQELHFVHHRHANCNFAVIHFFWDRILCTYRRPARDISYLKRFQEKEFEPWLSGQARTELLKPAANDVLERWPVSKRVNSSRASDDDASLIDKIELPTVVLS
jgi:sterol desaturase/sphingolipid hydroxylase (fatty acid hydroxylase superfamily)